MGFQGLQLLMSSLVAPILQRVVYPRTDPSLWDGVQCGQVGKREMNTQVSPSHKHTGSAFLFSFHLLKYCWCSHSQALCMTQKKEKNHKTYSRIPYLFHPVTTTARTLLQSKNKLWKTGKEVGPFPKRNSTVQERSVGSGVKRRSTDLQIA